MRIVSGGHFYFPQYRPPQFRVSGLAGMGKLAPEVAAASAFGQRTSLCKNGECVSPADPRVGIVGVHSKENADIYRGIRIQQLAPGKFVTDRKFPGDRRIGGPRSNRRQTWTPLYANSVAQMRRLIDQYLNTPPETFAPVRSVPVDGCCGKGLQSIGAQPSEPVTEPEPSPKPLLIGGAILAALLLSR